MSFASFPIFCIGSIISSFSWDFFLFHGLQIPWKTCTWGLGFLDDEPSDDESYPFPFFLIWGQIEAFVWEKPTQQSLSIFHSIPCFFFSPVCLLLFLFQGNWFPSFSLIEIYETLFRFFNLLFLCALGNLFIYLLYPISGLMTGFTTCTVEDVAVDISVLFVFHIWFLCFYILIVYIFFLWYFYSKEVWRWWEDIYFFSFFICWGNPMIIFSSTFELQSSFHLCRI